jgi:hypothetical protein
LRHVLFFADDKIINFVNTVTAPIQKIIPTPTCPLVTNSMPPSTAKKPVIDTANPDV